MFLCRSIRWLSWLRITLATADHPANHVLVQDEVHTRSIVTHDTILPLQSKFHKWVDFFTAPWRGAGNYGPRIFFRLKQAGNYDRLIVSDVRGGRFITNVC